jgi:acyl-CoA thioester hydrolase
MPDPNTQRADYRWFLKITPRWRDNDVFGHVNNAVFYEYVDTAVSTWIVEQAELEVPGGPVAGLVVESGCRFFAPLAFPEPVSAGLRVARIGNSSVRYEVGLFRDASEVRAAEAFYVHVYVDAATHRPVPLPKDFRTALNKIAVD